MFTGSPALQVRLGLSFPMPEGSGLRSVIQRKVGDKVGFVMGSDDHRV